MSDNLLPILPRIAAGEADAFSECVERYKRLIWWLARKLRTQDVEDAVQDIFIDLWKNAGRFDPAKSSESTFVGMIARRRLIDRMRKAGRTPASEPIETLHTLAGESHELIESSADAALARRAMTDLSEKEQEILRLSVHQGMTHSEIASHLNLPLGSVKSSIRRGLIRVRDKLVSNFEAVQSNPGLPAASR